MAKQERAEKEQTTAVAQAADRWAPATDLQPAWGWGRGFGSHIDRLMDRLFDEIALQRRPLQPMIGPAVDLVENETHYTLTAELPGVEKADVTIEVADGALTIRGEKRTEREEKSDRMRYSERSYGSFTRALALPRDADADAKHIEASFRDGVLSIRIPRTKDARASVVAIR